MKNKKIILTFLIIALLFYVDPIYAGPGGTVAKALFKTWWGKLILVALTIIFLPLILYVYIVEYFAIKKTKKQLKNLSTLNKDFSWLNLDKNTRNIFKRVHYAWDNEDLTEVSEYVNHWYWQNQQTVHLNKWEKDNLKNICKLESIKKIKPLYIEIGNNSSLEGSKIALSISANIEDYLINRETKKVVEGKKGFDIIDKIWILEYTGEKWLLDDIQDEDLTLYFAKMENFIPSLISQKIKETSLSSM